MTLQTQITKEMHRLNINGNHDDNVKIIGDTGLITFTVNDKSFWAKLTPTGKLKKNSIRINNF